VSITKSLRKGIWYYVEIWYSEGSTRCWLARPTSTGCISIAGWQKIPSQLVSVIL